MSAWSSRYALTAWMFSPIFLRNLPMVDCVGIFPAV